MKARNKLLPREALALAGRTVLRADGPTARPAVQPLYRDLRLRTYQARCEAGSGRRAPARQRGMGDAVGRGGSAAMTSGRAACLPVLVAVALDARL